MKRNICRYCSGKGFTYGTYSKIHGVWLREIGCKVPCKKCYGKGVLK